MCSLVEQLPAGNQITLSAMSAKPAVLWTSRADMWSAQVIFTIRSRRNPRGKDNDQLPKVICALQVRPLEHEARAPQVWPLEHETGAPQVWPHHTQKKRVNHAGEIELS